MSGRIAAGWFPPDPATYTYLLGLYLGDGCISYSSPRCAFLRITLDAVYPGIIDEAVRSVRRLLPPGSHVGVHRHPTARSVVVQATYQHWTDVFPQHGPGRKHERAIVLWNWQKLYVADQPEAFLRGLIHSDGARVIDRFKTRLPSGRVAEYEYPRYFFSNVSSDIRGLFCDTCDQLGIRWTQSNHRNISVSHRESVARLDAFVGPKR